MKPSFIRFATGPGAGLALGLPLLLTSSLHAQTDEPAEGFRDLGDVIDQKELEAMTELIKKDIESLRGKSFPRPTRVAVTTSEEFIAYAKKQLEEDTTPEEMAAEEAVAKLLGMLPVEMDLQKEMLGFLESQVGGFYDPETESFYLMDSFTGGLAKVILAHELTHALDDQLYDIDGTRAAFEGNSDRVLAYHGVVEGSGTAVMNAWSLDNMDQIAGVDLDQASALGATDEAPPYLWRPLMATYLRGSLFLNRTDSVLASTRMPQRDDFHYAFQQPPRSTEQLLHPEKYWNAKDRDEPIELDFREDDVPEGWKVLKEDTLGELVLACVIADLDDRGGMPTGIASLSTEYTFRASEGWGGDRVLLLGKGAARLLVLETRWDTEDDAREFDQALESLDGHLRGAAAGLAGEAGEHGVLRLFDRAGKSVTFLSWYGVPRREVAGAVATLRAVEPDAD